MSVPKNLKYTADHEWVRVEGEGDVVIGITDHAQSQLGDVVFVELPSPGTVFNKGGTFGTVESVKAVSDLFAPVSGEVTEVNETLQDTPELVNSDPFGQGWMIKIKLKQPQEIGSLLDSAAYEAKL